MGWPESPVLRCTGGAGDGYPESVSDVCLPVSDLQVGDPVEVELTVVLPESALSQGQGPVPAGLSPGTFLPIANGTADDASIRVVPDAGLGSSRDVGALGLPDHSMTGRSFRRLAWRPAHTMPAIACARPLRAYSTRCPLLQRKCTSRSLGQHPIDVLEVVRYSRPRPGLRNWFAYGKNSGMMDLSQLDGSHSRR